MHNLNMAWYSNMGLFYFSPAIKFNIFYQLCLESVFNQISVRFYSPQTMTGNHQHAANHLLNSTITPDEKQISGYDPKKFMSEQHNISSKRHTHTFTCQHTKTSKIVGLFKKSTLLNNLTEILASLSHDIMICKHCSASKV